MVTLTSSPCDPRQALAYAQKAVAQTVPYRWLHDDIVGDTRLTICEAACNRSVTPIWSWPEAEIALALKRAAKTQRNHEVDHKHTVSLEAVSERGA